MRIHKPTYSKALPEGAKIFTRKTGQHKGKQYAKFKDSKGHTAEARLTKSGDKILLETAHWHISFEDNLGIRRTLKAFTNRQATQRLADNVQRLLDCKASNAPLTDELQKWLVEELPVKMRDELIKFGLLDASQMAAGNTLDEYIKEFKDYMTKKERDPKHIKATISTLKRLFGACSFNSWNDIMADKLKAHLDELRDRGNGISKRTYNGYLKTAKHFCKWLAKQLHTISPLGYIDGLDNESTDRRHERRAATPDELRKLFETTRNSERRFGLTGYERSLVYWLTVETGLRADELRSLRKLSFDFDDGTITIIASYSKHRQEDVLPVRPELMTELKTYLTNKIPTAEAFYITDKTADMLKADLAEAEICYIDDNGKILDFHALRHTFITNLRNVSSRVAQSLARHRSSAMTDRYTHINLHDERQALDTLPDLTKPSKEKQRNAKTGTDDADVTDQILSKSCFRGTQSRTSIDNHRLKNLDTVEKTLLCVNNKGADATLNQRVTGSNPVSPIFSLFQFPTCFSWN